MVTSACASGLLLVASVMMPGSVSVDTAASARSEWDAAPGADTNRGRSRIGTMSTDRFTGTSLSSRSRPTCQIHHYDVHHGDTEAHTGEPSLSPCLGAS